MSKLTDNLATAGTIATLLVPLLTALDHQAAVFDFLRNVAAVAMEPLAEAVWQSILGGTLLAMLVIYVPPRFGFKSWWNPAKTKARARLWAFATTAALTWTRIPTERGVYYAIVAGMAAAAAWTTLNGLRARFFPCSSPESLQPNEPGA